MMNFTKLDITGCCLLEPVVHQDDRGDFFKTFHFDAFHRHDIDFDFKEEFVSVSKKGVLRGMHFQIPPSDHDKIVYCIRGTVIDGFVDLRKDSPSYKKSQTVQLTGENKSILFLPRGIAHGFFTISDEAVMIYKTSSVHNQDRDLGIHWRSCGIDWPTNSPILSERDQQFPDLESFESPFN